MGWLITDKGQKIRFKSTEFQAISVNILAAVIYGIRPCCNTSRFRIAGTPAYSADGISAPCPFGYRDDMASLWAIHAAQYGSTLLRPTRAMSAPSGSRLATGSVLSAPWCLGMRSCWAPFPWKIWTCWSIQPDEKSFHAIREGLSALPSARLILEPVSKGAGLAGTPLLWVEATAKTLPSRLKPTQFQATTVDRLAAGFPSPLPVQPSLPNYPRYCVATAFRVSGHGHFWDSASL